MTLSMGKGLVILKFDTTRTAMTNIGKPGKE